MQQIIKNLEIVFQMISKYSQISVYVNVNKLIKQLEENEPPESVANNILNKFKNIIRK